MVAAITRLEKQVSFNYNIIQGQRQEFQHINETVGRLQRDMDGVVAYVAPNDVNNNEDSAYDRFFESVGTKECRDRLNGVQREALVRREPLEKKYEAYAAENGFSVEWRGPLPEEAEPAPTATP